MKTCHVNVIVYVKEPIDREQNHRIRSSISALQGVVHAGPTNRTHALLCIDYDPTLISSQHILLGVTDQGYSARLVGM
jgi:ethanolamine ammonia-lyase small subunit